MSNVIKEMNILSIKINIKYDGYRALSSSFAGSHNYAGPMTKKAVY
jgi:hypothetical protein